MRQSCHNEGSGERYGRPEGLIGSLQRDAQAKTHLLNMASAQIADLIEGDFKNGRSTLRFNRPAAHPATVVIPIDTDYLVGVLVAVEVDAITLMNTHRVGGILDKTALMKCRLGEVRHEPLDAWISVCQSLQRNIFIF